MPNTIEKFLRYAGDTKSSKRIYRNHIDHFIKAMEINIDTYFQEDRDFSDDLLIFWDMLKDLSPTTKNGRITCIRRLFDSNKIEIDPDKWSYIKNKKKKARPVTVDHVPTPTELKEILQHGGVRDRALFLLASMSGLRIAEALHITFDDVEYKDIHGNLISPCKVIVRYEVAKNNIPRITYFPKEARDALIAWLKIRDEYLKSAVKKCNNNKALDLPKSLKDNRIFPFGETSARKMWYRLLHKSGYNKRDPKTNMYVIHIHCLRKWFINRMRREIRPDAVAQLAGHEGYLDVAYRRISEEELKELYILGMHSLAVFEAPSDLTDVRKNLKEMTDENQKLKNLLDKMDTRMQIMEMKLEQEKIKNHINSH